MSVYDDQKSDVDADFKNIVASNYAPGEADQVDKRIQDEHDSGVDNELRGIANGGGSDSKVADSSELAAKEADGSSGATSETDGQRWARVADSGTPEERADAIDDVKKKRGWRGLSKRAKAGILGGVTTLGVGGGMFGFTIISGPLEVVHFAQVLHNTHLSQQEDAGDMRTGKLIRWLRTGNIGETRLSRLGSKYHARILSDLEEHGIKPIDPTGKNNTGYELDTESEKSPYKGMTPEQATAEFEAKTGQKDLFAVKEGKATAGADSLLGGKQRAATRGVLKSLGKSRLATAARARNLFKFDGISWHPQSISDRLEKKLTIPLTDYFSEKWNKMVNKGIEPSTLDTTGAKDQQTDPNDPKNTTTTDVADGNSGTVTSTKASSTLKEIANSKGGKITGGLAAAVGIVCIMKSINDNIGLIRYAQIILPMTRLGMDLVTNGNQVMKGNDVDMQELGYIAHFLNDNGKDAQGKQVRTPSNANDAATIRSNTNQTGGVDVDNSTKSTFSGDTPGWLSWTSNGAVSTLCSSAVQAVTGAVSLVLGIFTGGVVSTVIGAVASAIAIPKLIDFVSGLIAGHAVDLANLLGAPFMNAADYGTTFGASSIALQMGATQETPAEQKATLTDAQNLQNDDRAHKTFFARAFDPMDANSLTGKLIDQNQGSVSGNMAALVTGFTHIGSTLLKMPASLITGKARAAPPSGYQYPFAVYGFSLADQNDPLVDNPYDNGDAAAKLLDGAQSSDITSLAQTCFGVDIKKVPAADDTSDLVWDAYPTQDISSTVYQKSYDNARCQRGPESISPGDWKRIRFFILDSGVMSGYTCAQFDDKDSCSENDGNGPASAAASTSTTSTGGGSIPTGDTITLAQQIAAKMTGPNATISFQTKQDSDYFDHILATGKATDCGAPTISPKLLGVILALSNNYKIVLGVFDDGHGCDGGFHPRGMAVDINGINPIPGNPVSGGLAGTGNQLHWTSSDMPITRSFYQSAGQTLAANGGGGLGQTQCFTGGPYPHVNGVTYFPDSCTHLHMDVGVR